MDYNKLGYNQEVWVKSGEYKGRKGRVDMKGFGVVNVRFDSETKSFTPDNLTTENPQTVPLPPNFLPLDHKIGDRVEVSGHGYNPFNGITGTVTKLPTSTTYRNGGEKRYRISVTDGGKSSYTAGDVLYFEPATLKAAKPQRVEGEEIEHADVQINDVIRVELRSGSGGYTQTSMKEAKVGVITKRLHPEYSHPSQVYIFKTSISDGNCLLNYGHKNEKITLVKAAENPWKAIIDGLQAGTVVVRTNADSCSTSTFVKSPDVHGSSQWHVMHSGSTRSSSFVTDSDVIRVLSEADAEIVHKVHRKK